MVVGSRPRTSAQVAILAALLILTVAVVAFTAAPASANSAWQHDGATVCGTAGCHGITHLANRGPSDADCVSCHTGGFKTPAKVYSTYCWDCHQPGQDDIATWQTSAGCTTTCHLAVAPTEDDCDNCHYAEFRALTFSHGTWLHAGADSAPCLNCHAISVSATDPGNSPHHGGTLPSIDDCESCHNGQQASLKVNHDGITDCQTCHNGMDIPAVPAKCNQCHLPTQVGTGNCTDSTCHGTEVIHTATPAAVTDCTDCHGAQTTGHFTGLGTCTDCHTDVAGYHHLGTPAIPLEDCTACHDGTIASAKVNHDGLTSCQSCHTGMDIPPVPQKCNTCHTPAQVGTGDCTSSSCHGTAVIHNANPQTAANCASCHADKATGHYAGLGTCRTCHTDVVGYHHQGRQAIPLEDCTACHDGTIASAKVNHDGLTNCQSCHTGMDIPPVPQKCNTCHTPAQVGTGTCTNSSCHGTEVIHTADPQAASNCASCHADKVVGHFTGVATCRDCHTDVVGYHHQGRQTIPLEDCTACHDGTIASAKVNHDGLASCTSCHTGMNVPSIPQNCNTCHSASSFGTGSCTNAACHTSAAVHTATPGMNKACVDCHTGQATGHFAGLGTCTDCHTDVPGYHHMGASAIPLEDCTACHDGTIASAKVNHDGLTDCQSCHTGMNVPPVPQTCNTCHTPAQVGTGTCTDAGCHGTEVIHTDDPQGAVDCTSCHADKATALHFKDVASCRDCHTDVVGYHHQGKKAIPLDQCTACHDGTIASAKEPHDGLTTCTGCHIRMEIRDQSENCNWCHGAPSVKRPCTDCHSTSGVFEQEQIHSKAPASSKTCADCHAPHYADIAACETCHRKSTQAHHGAVTPAPSTLVLGADDYEIVYGAAVTLSGLLTSEGKPLAGESVIIQATTPGASGYVDVGTATVGVGGSFSLAVDPVEKTTYRAVFKGTVAGSTVYGPAVATTSIAVHPVVTLKLSNATGVSGSYSLYPLGRKVIERGSVQPNHALLGDGATKGFVTLTGYKYKYSPSLKRYAWVKVTSVKRTLDGASRYSWTWTPGSKGKFRVIARFAADLDHLAAQSPYRYLRVY